MEGRSLSGAYVLTYQRDESETDGPRKVVSPVKYRMIVRPYYHPHDQDQASPVGPKTSILHGGWLCGLGLHILTKSRRH
jgi:hypothetical protein